MSLELRITRAEFWISNGKCPITESEWLAYIQSDESLERVPESGPFYVRWNDPEERCKYASPWFNWKSGNITTEWPDTYMYKKMLQMAEALQAKIQDDDGAVYTAIGEWEFDPASPELKKLPPPKLPWWKKALVMFG